MCRLYMCCLYMQAETLGQKRVSEEAIKRLKAEAQQAVRRRETALFNAREAVVSFVSTNLRVRISYITSMPRDSFGRRYN